MPSSSVNAIPALRSNVRGRVITPQDAGYDEARTIFLGGFDVRPAVIVRPADAVDVARVVTFARDSGIPLAVRSGGHSGAGHCTIEDGVVLDLRDMHAIDIDVNPAYGPDDSGNAGAVDPSLSVAVSSFAKQSRSAQPDSAWVSKLPADQRCG